MIRSDLRTLILGWLDDVNGSYFTASLVNTWLNLAQRRVQLKLIRSGQQWYEKPVETITVAGQADYMLPSDFIIEHRMELVISGTGSNENVQPIMPMTTMQRDQVSFVQGIPIRYHIKKDRFTLSPIPSGAFTLRMWYSPRAADMTADSDSPDVPEQYMEYVALTACFDGFIKDDRMPDVLVAKKREVDDELAKSAQQRHADGPRMVLVTSDLDGGGDFA